MIDKLVGIVGIIFGGWLLRWTYKNRIPAGEDYLASNLKFYMVGFFAILFGVLTIMGYFGNFF